MKWSVEPLSGMPAVELGDNGLDWADKAMLSSYNAEMNGVITAFKNWKKDAESDAYYLFIVPKFSEGGVEGFMPRNRRFGFITQEQLVPRTVAHELGHGAFNLRHTFPEAPQGSTDNLMDYAGGTGLYKPQWDLIHNPEFTTGLWDGMEDGAAILEPEMPADSIKFLINKIHKANINKVEYLDISKFALSQGVVKDLVIELLKPDYMGIQVFGELKPKDTGGDNQSDPVKKLYISPSDFKVEKSNVPKGEKGYFVRYIFNKYVKENDKYKKSDSPAIVMTTRGRYTQMLKEYLKGNPIPDIKFPCEECGKDLTLNLQKLKQIFPDNDAINQAHVDCFNDAFKKGEFTTCKRQAHFFSQVDIETEHFTKFEEGYWYTLLGIYSTFGNQSNDSYKTLYNQNFWDNNKHLNYTGSPLCSHLYDKKTNKTEIKDKNKRFVGDGSVPKTRSGLTITFPQSFNKDTTGIYIQHTITDKKKCGENLFNLVYKDINGNNEAGDGWKYRGRGAIQVTGKANYKATSDKCNSLFTKNYDWQNNPDDLKDPSKPDAIIYSAVAWFLNNFVPINILDSKNSNQVTGIVNVKKEKEQERSNKFEELMNDSQLFKCEKK